MAKKTKKAEQNAGANASAPPLRTPEPFPVAAQPARLQGIGIPGLRNSGMSATVTAEPTVFAFATWHAGGGAYHRAIVQLPMSVIDRYAIKRSNEADLPMLATADANDFVQRVISGQLR